MSDQHQVTVQTGQEARAPLLSDSSFWRALATLQAGGTPELSPKIISGLPAVLAEFEFQLEPATPEQIVASLARITALIGTRMSENQMTEWMAAIGDRLMELPGRLVIEGLREAELKVDDERKVLPFVVAYCGDTAPQRARLAAVQTLQTMAQSGQSAT